MERSDRARDVGHGEYETTTIRFGDGTDNMAIGIKRKWRAHAGDGLYGQDLLLLNLVAIHQAGPQKKAKPHRVRSPQS